MLSLCMIVRDEEANLPCVLESVRGLADECVVVDTGSRDRTAEIARSFGARVDFFEWRDDFAAARNRALDLARGEWILSLDADDVFEREDIPEAKRILASADCEGLTVRQKLSIPDGTSWIKRHLAFFRNRPEHRYVLRVHERVTIDPERTGSTKIRIEHRGYRKELLAPKLERNRRLVERMRSDPDPLSNVAASFLLGGFHRMDGDLAAAWKSFAEAAYSGFPCEYRLWAAIELARLAADLGDASFAESLLRALRAGNHGSVEAELGLADLMLAQERREEARAHLAAADRSSLRVFPQDGAPLERDARRRLARLAGP
ncbi:MAG: glycosyltransferase [Planctomycetes bacterium]|nr:glycosyltransferase [Planctomycetota bacterium]